MYTLVVLFSLLVVALSQETDEKPLILGNLTALPIFATWYCSLDGSHGRCFPGSCGTSSPPSNGFGIVAFNPLAYTSGPTCHYRGSSCGDCWQISGPSGSAKVMVTDCCAGYPNSCSCLSCPHVSNCDWCAKNDNFHFDMDIDSFRRVCGNSGITAGHCQAQTATRISC